MCRRHVFLTRGKGEAVRLHTGFDHIKWVDGEPQLMDPSGVLISNGQTKGNSEVAGGDLEKKTEQAEALTA